MNFNLDSPRYERTTQNYLNWFGFLTGIKNRFIIYVDSIEIADAIYALRAKHGLESQTLVIQKKLDSFAPDDYEKMKKLDRTLFAYVMYCKSFCVVDALQNPLTKDFVTDRIMWLDFGFNKSDDTFRKSKDFDFTLAPQTDLIIDSKINFFAYWIDSPIILIGGLTYGDRKSWLHLNMRMREANKVMLDSNVVLEDQGLYGCLVTKYPEEFNVLQTDGWFKTLFYFIPESKRKNISIKDTSILQKTFNQDNIVKYIQDVDIFSKKGIQKFWRKMKRSVKRRYMTIRNFFEDLNDR
ncbi:WlaTC/HtrL family glycosyltransferase [Helicobacter didelphidarum]|uniref:WlaTC/HtrL family glycosyltransferase n=1 Tax=Helicobacter didelphidarum TaxID=2040648 RepID=UPI0015F1929F|nr:WlaTC/HtrL family glycosyltransferase [Helicobacter didelphidarum]